MLVENIGKVQLDLEFYPGEDLYCDGTVEDDILEAVKNLEDGNYKAVIEDRNNWPFLYHLSELRGNIVSWFPMDKRTKVLEIGSGCGAITSAVAPKCGELTCVDLSKKRSLINAYRNKDRDNITIKVGNFTDVEPSLDNDYDLILLIGVFEYAAAYIGSESPYTTFLDIIKKHVKKDGHIIIAIENRMGLKYLSGCMEDHLGNYFSGVENYPEGGVVRTFTRPGLEKIFRKCGVEKYNFYYPYPDYKFMHTLYSDDRLPFKGELTTNLRNFDRDRLLLFDEKNAFDSIIDDGKFDYFSNSYLVVIGDKPEIVYSRFSNDRADDYAIRTDIALKDGKCEVYKAAASDAGKTHIANIKKAYDMLSARFEGSSLNVCKCNNNEGILSFQYIDGITLEEMLDGAINDMDRFVALIKDYYERISYNLDAEVTDYDLIFPNIIVDGNNNWHVIDYEWTYEKKTEPEELLARAVYCYLLGAGNRSALDGEDILYRVTGRSGLYNKEKLNLDEINFQKQVTAGHKSLSEMRDSIHNEVLPLSDAILNYKNQQREKMVQVYMDNGNGFSESGSIFMMPDKDKDDNGNIIKIKLRETDINLRFDPSMKPCMIGMVRAYIEREDGQVIAYPQNKISHNGTLMPGEIFGFIHNDANVTFSFKYLKKYQFAEGDRFVISYKEIK